MRANKPLDESGVRPWKSISLNVERWTADVRKKEIPPTDSDEAHG